LLASRQGEWLIAGDTDLAQTTGISVVKPGRSPQDELLRLLKQQKVRRLGIDMKNISHDLHTKLVSARIRPVDVGDRLRQMRAVKSGAEIRSIREACRLADRAMDAACGSIRPGVTERSIRQAALSVLEECEAQAFDFIVASGDNSLYTHCFPSDRRISRTDLVIVDLGLVVEGYRSDITRTFCLEPGEEQRALYAAVAEAQDLALKAIRPGTRCGDVCEKVGKFLEKHNLRKYWKYGLGHGVGLDIHEPPSLSRESLDVLKQGMTFTVEPGLHVPGICGVRIEDVVLLRKKPEKLTRTAYGLIP
jgi:Xaa-Pro aminopeptidase